MKNILRTFVLFIGILIATVTVVVAQQFEGVATYQSSRKMTGFKLKGEGMSKEMEEQFKAQLQKQFQKEYTLKFNLSESLWKEVESLDGGPATASAGGVVIRMASGSGATYKNTSENIYLRETEVFSKPFLVNDQLEQRSWKITNETKQIGDYTAQKAIFQDIRESRSISFTSDDSKDSTGSEIRIDTINIEAWFTSQIPVSQGPEDFWGLPGLILELKNGNTTYLCTKIQLNPAEGVEIKKPTKGKEVTRDELKVVIDEKTAEMAEKFGNGGKGNIHIKMSGN